MRRALAEGYELDDGRGRDAGSAGTYCAAGRPLAEVERRVGEATRVVALSRAGARAGFARCLSDGTAFADG